jgi:outer membrane usher protein
VANGRATAQASASGSIVWMDGAVFAAAPIRDSFALVDTGGLAGVPVLADNQLVGHTNRAGKLILTDLRSFEANKVSIETKDLPLTAIVAGENLFVRPADHAGIVARFDVREENAVLITLVDEAGVPILVGASARLRGGSGAEPVGYDGQLFLQGVARHDVLDVDLGAGAHCTASFEVPPGRTSIAEIGPIACRSTA